MNLEQKRLNLQKDFDELLEAGVIKTKDDVNSHFSFDECALMLDHLIESFERINCQPINEKGG